MNNDARFEDGGAKPLRLVAHDLEDLKVVSSLVQDGVTSVGDIKWQPQMRRFAILINRFRWEDGSAQPERVRCLAVFDDVKAVMTAGVDPADKEMILSLLSLSWVPTEDGAGRIELILAGDGHIGLDVECINATLQDVTRPYLAPSGKTPTHPQ